jgi:hypothetical protein
MFDVIVNKNDNTRVDLIIASDQNLYLKAIDYKERQKWLLALATQRSRLPATSLSKATTSQSSNHNNKHQHVLPSLSINTQSSDDHLQNTTSTSTFEILNTNYQNLTSYDTTNMLKIKQSELRLYCDLLTQQTYDIKNLIVGFNSNYSKKIDVPQILNSSDNLNESNKTDEFLDNLDTAKYLNKTLGQMKSNDNLSMLSFKSASSAFAGIALNQAEKSNGAMDNNNTNNNNNNINSEDEILDSSLNEYPDSNVEAIKKMDDITSNINITCDMLIQIIRNLIILSNTSSNISSAAVTSLLNNLPPPPHSTSSSHSSAETAIVTDSMTPKSSLTNQFQTINLDNPIYTNDQLNHFRLRNQSSTSFDTESTASQLQTRQK